MDDSIKIVPHPILQELKFPRKTLITLDITKFNYESATCCFTAVRNAITEQLGGES